jgi:hypothetical protein
MWNAKKNDTSNNMDNWNSLKIIRLQWTDFDKTWYLGFFRKICQEDSSFIKLRQEQRVLYMKTFRYFSRYLAKFFLEWEMF